VSEFDRHAGAYEEALADATAFAGANPVVYTEAKATLLRGLARERLGTERVRALDVGCGPGLVHRFLTPHVESLHGVDVAARLLDEAREANPDAVYAETDGTTLPFPDDSFDLSFTICVLHHVPPVERQRFMHEMARVTRPGGIVAVIEHNRFNPGTRRVVRTCVFDDDAILLPAREARHLLRDAGLDDLSVRYFLFSPWRPRAAERAERLLGAVPLGAQYVAVGTV
jgi:SAM-dependent methyltransferase